MLMYDAKESSLIRKKYIHSFVNTKSVYYKKHVRKKKRYCDGLCYDGYLWVTSGITNPAHVYAIDLVTAEILLDIEAENGEWNFESEAISWMNEYTLLVGTKNRGSNTGMFKVTFPDIEALSNLG